jgi:hypothetical protein
MPLLLNPVIITLTIAYIACIYFRNYNHYTRKQPISDQRAIVNEGAKTGNYLLKIKI